MLKIHEKSQLTTIPDLDIFSVPPTQESIERTYYTEHRPLSTISSSQQIQFSITSSKDEYLNLRDMLFYIKLKINLKKASNVVAADWKKIAPVNNLLHSIFKNIHLDIDNKNVTKSSPTYSYKAYFESLLGFTEASKCGYMSSQGWYSDFDQHIQTFNDEYSRSITPSTINTDGTGKSIELCGKLHLDLAMQPKSIVGGTKIIITLVPNEPNFYLWITENALNASVIFEDAALYVSRSKVIQPIVEIHNHLLEKNTAKYPIMRGVVKTFPITSGLTDVNLDNAIVGQIPRRIFIGLVDSKGYNGDKTVNPYNFENLNLNSLAASLDGEIFPSIPIKPNFTDGHYAREYLSLFDTLNQLNTDSALTTDMKEWANGLTIYGLTFAPDPIDDCNKSGYWNPKRNGAININMKFGTALPKNINAIIYCEYDNLVQIDKTRTVITDYI